MSIILFFSAENPISATKYRTLPNGSIVHLSPGLRLIKGKTASMSLNAAVCEDYHTEAVHQSPVSTGCYARKN